MKFSAVLVFAIGALALPQDASVTSAPASAAPIPSGLTPAVSCVLACDPADVTCQAACMGNARPNASQAVETNECAAKCDQGDGSKAASDAFAKCVSSCINSLFPSSQTAFAGPGAAASAGGASAAASATNSANPTATTPGSSASATGSESGSAASPLATGAADRMSAGLAGAGFAGLLAVFAL
ncbi:hypothetical protein BDW02DRAFT_565989 [Decorospora gaudefroyi]|uniref:Extracellular membrane protein CFEM domain-containing protein n=1 Tax=Decorospora gaudefroyi TaxID=184978 RepID=A0A6A5KNL4_9PLEO|nr:hypothetical protein BDW02DRAFT_565989 [Decorospora gaudefroyi]